MCHDYTKIKAKETIETHSVTFFFIFLFFLLPQPLLESMLCSFKEPKHVCLNMFLATVLNSSEFFYVQNSLKSLYANPCPG